MNHLHFHSPSNWIKRNTKTSQISEQSENARLSEEELNLESGDSKGTLSKIFTENPSLKITENDGSRGELHTPGFENCTPNNLQLSPQKFTLVFN